MEKIYRVQMNAKGMPNFATAQEVADRPQGKWIEQEDCWQCSECGDEYVLEVDVKPIDAKMYYCPNCGAKMADRKTEPTISKMEQVDKDINVRSKDEPQTEREDK